MRELVVQVVVVVLLPCVCCMQTRQTWSKCPQGNHTKNKAEHATCVLCGTVSCGVRCGRSYEEEMQPSRQEVGAVKARAIKQRLCRYN